MNCSLPVFPAAGAAARVKGSGGARGLGHAGVFAAPRAVQSSQLQVASVGRILSRRRRPWSRNAEAPASRGALLGPGEAAICILGGRDPGRICPRVHWRGCWQGASASH